MNLKTVMTHHDCSGKSVGIVDFFLFLYTSTIETLYMSSVSWLWLCKGQNRVRISELFFENVPRERG
jgi:hypothetical protein